MEYRRIIPNSISGTNLILGVLSIFESVAGNFEWAAIYIILAVAVDACDGRAARALGVAGKFGVEMDSLLRRLFVRRCACRNDVLLRHDRFRHLGQLIAALFPVWGALRLARFNINADVIHGYFQGMPIPGGALCSGCVRAFRLRRAAELCCRTDLCYRLHFVQHLSVIRIFKGKGNPLF